MPGSGSEWRRFSDDHATGAVCRSSELVANARMEFLDQTDRFRFKTGKAETVFRTAD